MSLRERIFGPSKSAREIATLQARVESLQGVMLADRMKRHTPVQSGVPLNFGQYEYEGNKKLRNSATAWDEFAKMETDPRVKDALRNAKLPLQLGEWSIEPATEDARDVEIADFCKANLLRESTDRFGKDYWIRTPWKAQRLPEILRMLEDGFSMFAKSTRVVGTKVVYDRLQWLEPESVDSRGWKLDEFDNLIRVDRTFNSNEKFVHLQPLQASQICLYVHELVGARFEGTRFTRSLYGAWFRKEFMQRMKAIYAQKIGNPPPYGILPKGYPADKIPEFQDFIESLRNTIVPEIFGVFQAGEDGKEPTIKYAGAEHGEVDRMGALIDGENAEIAAGGGRKSALLGETQSGSRALGSTQGMVEMVLVEALAAIVCEWETHGVGNLPGVIEELVNWNYAGVQAYPKLICSKINPFQMAQTSEFRKWLWDKNVIPKIPEVRKQLAESGALNISDDAFDEMEEVAPLPFGTPPPPPGVQGPPPSADREESAAAAVALSAHETIEAFRARIAPMLEPAGAAPSGAGFRAPNRLESSVLNLAAVRESFRIGERDFRAVAGKGHRAMIAELMGRLRAGKVTARNVGGQRRSKFKGEASLQKQFVAVARRVGREGMGHVQTEVSVQTTREEVA